MNQLSATYKIYLEAEDVSFSRIQSSVTFVKNLLAGSSNSYLRQSVIEDESEPGEYTLRCSIAGDIREAECTSQEDAGGLAFDLAQSLETIAGANSYMEMEGSLSWQYGTERKNYKFRSESGQDYCDIQAEDPVRAGTGEAARTATETTDTGTAG